MKNLVWTKIEGKEKEEFLNIYRIRNSHYRSSSIDNEEDFLSVKKMLKSNTGKLSIEIAECPETAVIPKNSFSIKIDLGSEEFSWIHVDTIETERENLLSYGVTEHPIFELKNVTDIFKALKKVKGDKT